MSLYGGMPRVVWSLTRALSDLKHKVYILCAKGSKCPFAQIVERNPELTIAQQIPADTDIVHFHSPVPSNFTFPFVETIHGNFNKNITINAVFLSHNHAQRFDSECFVYNGLDWNDAEYANPNLSLVRSHYHFLGKAAWKVKNVQGAISVVKRLENAHLDVLGGNRFNFHMGWRFTLSRRISFYGMCGGEQKRSLLSGSRGLIFPVLWHEPFGLAVIESLYFGAPVFSTPYGALPEIVTAEVGAMSDSESEMAYIIANADFSPQQCHEYARQKFSALQMAEGYMDKYEKVLSGQQLNLTLPHKLSAESKIVWRK